MTINLAQPLCCQQENSLTRVRLCVTKFGISVRTHTKHDFQSPVNPSDFVEKTAIISQNFSDSQAVFPETRLDAPCGNCQQSIQLFHEG